MRRRDVGLVERLPNDIGASLAVHPNRESEGYDSWNYFISACVICSRLCRIDS